MTVKSSLRFALVLAVVPTLAQADASLFQLSPQKAQAFACDEVRDGLAEINRWEKGYSSLTDKLRNQVDEQRRQGVPTFDAPEFTQEKFILDSMRFRLNAIGRTLGCN